MSFVGKLEDLAAPDLLSAIANGRKTGKLTVTRADGFVVVVFRLGSIIYASSDLARETLGGLLVAKGDISDETLTQALEQQHRFKETRRLGRILLDMNVVDIGVLQEALRQQSESVLGQLFRWENGFFKFELLEKPESDDDDVKVEVDLGDLLIQDGLATQEVMMEVMRQLDEASRKEKQPTAPQSEILAAIEDVLDGASLDASQLLQHMKELRDAPTTKEISDTLLRSAKEHFRRGVFFLPRGKEIRGMSHFGIGKDDASGSKKVQALRIAMDPPSTLSEVVATGEAFNGPLESNYWNEYLVRELGGEVPTESAVLPVVVGTHCALLLYGDNLPTTDPLGSLTELRILFVHAGLAIERKMLEKRVTGKA